MSQTMDISSTVMNKRSSIQKIEDDVSTEPCTLGIPVSIDPLDDLPDVGPVLEKAGIWDDTSDTANSLRSLDMYDFSPDNDDGEDLQFDKFLCEEEHETNAVVSLGTQFSSVPDSIALSSCNAAMSNEQLLQPPTFFPQLLSGRIAALNGGVVSFSGSSQQVLAFEQSLLSAISGSSLVQQQPPLTHSSVGSLQPAVLRPLSGTTVAGLAKQLQPIIGPALPVNCAMTRVASLPAVCGMVNCQVMASPSKPVPRNRHCKVRSATVDCTVVAPSPSKGKDTQEYERVMDILKQYRVQIEERSVDATMPCKRRKSRPLVASMEPVKCSTSSSTNLCSTNWSSNCIVSASSSPSSNGRLSLHSQTFEHASDASWRNGDGCFSDSCGSNSSAVDAVSGVQHSFAKRDKVLTDSNAVPVTKTVSCDFAGAAMSFFSLKNHTANNEDIALSSGGLTLPQSVGVSELKSPSSHSVEHSYLGSKSSVSPNSNDDSAAEISGPANLHEFPLCNCPNSDSDLDGRNRPWYTHLGAASSLDEIRQLMKQRFEVDDDSIRVEKIAYVEYNGSTPLETTFVNRILRRSKPQEKVLCLAHQRPGHICVSAFLIVLIVVWDGLEASEGDAVFEQLMQLLVKSEDDTGKPFGANILETSADHESEMSSDNLTSVLPLLNNDTPKNISDLQCRMVKDLQDPELRHHLHCLTSKIVSFCDEVVPDTFRNMERNESSSANNFHTDEMDRQQPVSGVTVDVEYSRQTKDVPHSDGGCTVALTSIKYHNSSASCHNKQFHVLPQHPFELMEPCGVTGEEVHSMSNTPSQCHEASPGLQNTPEDSHTINQLDPGSRTRERSALSRLALKRKIEPQCSSPNDAKRQMEIKATCELGSLKVEKEEYFSPKVSRVCASNGSVNLINNKPDHSSECKLSTSELDNGELNRRSSPEEAQSSESAMPSDHSQSEHSIVEPISVTSASNCSTMNCINTDGEFAVGNGAPVNTTVSDQQAATPNGIVENGHCSSPKTISAADNANGSPAALPALSCKDDSMCCQSSMMQHSMTDEAVATNMKVGSGSSAVVQSSPEIPVEYDKENSGGVGVALLHGSIMFEASACKVRVTVGVGSRECQPSTRMALIFHLRHMPRQHQRNSSSKDVTASQEMQRVYASKSDDSADGPEDDIRQPRSDSVLSGNCSSSLGPSITNDQLLLSTNEKYGWVCATPVNRSSTLTTDTMVIKWIKPQPVITGPYQCWG